MTTLERRAEFDKAVRLNNENALDVIQNVFGISYNHFRQILENNRRPSGDLAERICRYVGKSLNEFWGTTDFNPSNQYLYRPNPKLHSDGDDEPDDKRI